MSSISNSIKKVINGVNNTQYTSVIAEIISFDGTTNTASITFNDPNSQGIQVLDNVPIDLGGSGIHTAGPFIRDNANVDFQNGSILQPKITAIIDEGYQYVSRARLQHTDSGANLTDPVPTIDPTTLPTNASSDWVDSTSTPTNKYLQYQNIDPTSDLITKTSTTSYYSTTEPGLTHPTTKATIKLKDDGNIDIFINSNIGIRVNTVTSSVDIYGDVNVNGNLNVSGTTTNTVGTTNTDITSNGG
jgi:hypothetical protein